MKEGKTLRVLFFNYEYPPLGGGAANANRYLLQAYQKDPTIQVDLITASPDQETHTQVLSPQITVHTLPIGKTPHTLHHQSQLDLVRYSIRASGFARQLLKTNHYDVIHAFFSVPCGALAWWLGKKHRIPYIVSLRGADVPGYSERFLFLYIFLTPLITKIWRSAYRVISNSQGLKELALRSAPQQPIGVIPNGVDTEKFSPHPENIPKEEWIITAGATRLTARKGIHLIIEALPELITVQPNIIFEVMGDGASLGALQELTKALGIENHVRFLGRIDAAQTCAYYTRARVFVLPSANEGMSNALLEALASGLPVVVTNTGGSGELVEEGKNGFIIPRTKEAIVDSVRKLLADESLRQALGQESRARAEAHSWSTVADEYIQLYRAATKDRV